MADPAKKIATYADIEALPPHVVGELIYGSLVTHPRPSPPHSVAQNSLGDELTSPFQKGRGGPGGWIFMSEPDLILGGNTVVPDLVAWRRERMPRIPKTGQISVSPDWLCEILSPSTERYDRNEKRRIYAQAGVAFYWMLDPRIGQLECFQLVAGNWLLTNTFAQDEIVNAPPFIEHSFPLSNLFPDTESEKSPE